MAIQGIIDLKNEQVLTIIQTQKEAENCPHTKIRMWYQGHRNAKVCKPGKQKTRTLIFSGQIILAGHIHSNTKLKPVHANYFEENIFQLTTWLLYGKRW